MSKPRWLIFAVGNPSRGDDALGPLLIERLEAWRKDRALPIALALLTDFQFQIEHALDLEGLDLVIFIDASRSASAPFECAPITPKFDATHSTHAASPQLVLAVAERLGQSSPRALLMAIRGERFELGDALSAQAEQGIDAAFAHLVAALENGRAPNSREE